MQNFKINWLSPLINGVDFFFSMSTPFWCDQTHRDKNTTLIFFSLQSDDSATNILANVNSIDSTETGIGTLQFRERILILIQVQTVVLQEVGRNIIFRHAVLKAVWLIL